MSPDRDLEGDCARLVAEAQTAHKRAGEETRKCDAAARDVDPYSDRMERRDAARDAAGHAKRAEMHADEAELAADGVEWTAQQIAAGDREMAAMGGDWMTTFRGWRGR